MIEKVATVLIDPAFFFATAEEDAERAIDAILPQVSSVEELEALPIGTVLVYEDGIPVWVDILPLGNPEVRCYRFGQNAATRHASVVMEAGSLTVVWQP